MRSIYSLLSAVIVFTSPISAWAQDDTGNSLAAVDLPYDCAQTTAIKFNPEAYYKLSYNEQRWIDMKWYKCQPPKKDQPAGDSQEIIIVNPVATNDDDKVFYGTITHKQLAEARATCTKAGGVGGVVISVAGSVTGNPAASEVGTIVFNYSDVACSSLSSEIGKGNLLAILGPNTIVGHAVANKLTEDVVDNIPLVSGADKDRLKDLAEKALQPPSVNVTGPNVTVSAAGASVSLKKPRVVIGQPKAPEIKLPNVPTPRIKCFKVLGKKICP